MNKILVLLGIWLSLGFTPGDPAPRRPALQWGALIQERGALLSGGRVIGGGAVALERAAGGDTPILTFNSAFGPVRLLLDTGASSAVVSPDLVRRLQLASRPLPAGSFSLAGGGVDCQSLQISSTRLPELRLSPSGPVPALRVQAVEALVIPLEALPKGVDGVIGAPTLKQLPFVIDPLQGIVLLGPPAQMWRQAAGAPSQVMPLAFRRGVPLLRIRVQSGPGLPARTLDALVDTGAEGLFLTPQLARMLTPLGAAQAAQMVGFCGHQQVLRQRLLGIGLGSQNPPNQSVEAIVSDGPVFALLGVQAIIGQEWLRTRRQFWRLDSEAPRLELW